MSFGKDGIFQLAIRFVWAALKYIIKVAVDQWQCYINTDINASQSFVTEKTIMEETIKELTENSQEITNNF